MKVSDYEYFTLAQRLLETLLMGFFLIFAKIIEI